MVAKAGARRLVLMRHAKSDWPDVPDHERPLAARGRRDAPRVGRWLRRSEWPPDAVVCSTAVRARQTWELVAPELGVAPAVRLEPRVYEATALALLMLVRELPGSARTALIVGHNPGIAELAAGLAGPDGERLHRFPTAAVAVLEAEREWADAAAGEAKLRAFVTPGELRA